MFLLASLVEVLVWHLLGPPLALTAESLLIPSQSGPKQAWSLLCGRGKSGQVCLCCKLLITTAPGFCEAHVRQAMQSAFKTGIHWGWQPPPCLFPCHEVSNEPGMLIGFKSPSPNGDLPLAWYGGCARARWERRWNLSVCCSGGASSRLLPHLHRGASGTQSLAQPEMHSGFWGKASEVCFELSVEMAAVP